MLHHVPSAELQDRLLREVHRVLRPGAPFAGSDSTPTPLFLLAHIRDTMVLPLVQGGVQAGFERGMHGGTPVGVQTFAGISKQWTKQWTKQAQLFKHHSNASVPDPVQAAQHCLLRPAECSGSQSLMSNPCTA